MELVQAAFPKMMAGSLTLQPQDESKASTWEGRRPEDGRIDLTGSIHEAERLIRAVARPYPGAFYDEGDLRIVVWRAKIAEPGEDLAGARAITFRDGVLVALEWDTQEIMVST